MQNNHLSDEELQLIAFSLEPDEAQQRHLKVCKKCLENLRMYKMITFSLHTAPDYKTAHLNSDLIFKKLDNKVFSLLFSPKVEVYFIVFLFLAAVIASVIFTNFLPSLRTVDFSAILKILSESEVIKDMIRLISTNSRIFIYLPFVVLTFFITLLFEKIISSVKHRTNHT